MPTNAPTTSSIPIATASPSPSGIPKGSKNDGGPAFPFEFEEHQVDGPPETLVHAGMSLRDYFAAQAMPALIARQPAGNLESDVTCQNIATASYELADFMLEARKR